MYKYFMKQNKILIIVLLTIIFLFLMPYEVNAYSGGDGTCDCGNGSIPLGGNDTDACVDCSAALNDNTNCANQVNYVGTVQISNYTGTCIDNPANFSNKIFDCQGHTIDGDDSDVDYGIFLSGKSGNIIKNCVVTDFFYGIYLNSSSNNNITNNTANSNNETGLLLYQSNNNNITSNTFENNSQTCSDPANLTYGAGNCGAIHLLNATTNIFTDNNITNNYRHGIFFNDTNSTGNKINTNTICLNNQSGGDYYDVYNENPTTAGDNNTFCTAYNYYDDGENSSHPMTYSCFVNFTITLNSPANNSITSNATPTFNFTTAGDTDTYSCELFINNTGHGTTTANNNTATTITSNQSLANGIYIWNITCSVCGNINSSESRILTINDTTSPTIEITYPSSNSIVNNYIINGTSTDENLNYTNISIKQGNTIINSTINTSANWSVSLYVSDGTYNITATAYDKAGNENSTININITIDTTPPQIGNASATPSADRGQSITLTVDDATDENLNTSKVIAQITDPNNEITNHTMSYSSGNTYSYTFISNKIGLYSYTFFAFDTADNSNSSSGTTTLVTSSGGGGGSGGSGGSGGGGAVSSGDKLNYNLTYLTDLCAGENITIKFPYSDFGVFLDGKRIGYTDRNGKITFITTEGKHLLVFIHIGNRQEYNISVKNCIKAFCGDKICSEGENETCPSDCVFDVVQSIAIVLSPQKVFKGREFTIIIIDDKNHVVEDATVIYGNQTKTTDKNGKATFTGFLGMRDITATKGNLTASSQITDIYSEPIDNIINKINNSLNCCFFSFGCGIVFIFCWYWWLLLSVIIIVLGVIYKFWLKQQDKYHIEQIFKEIKQEQKPKEKEDKRARARAKDKKAKAKKIKKEKIKQEQKPKEKEDKRARARAKKDKKRKNKTRAKKDKKRKNKILKQTNKNR